MPRKIIKKQGNTKNLQIEKQLVSIYKDDRGNLPDMKRIKIKKNRSILKTFAYFLIFCAVLAGVAWAGFFLMPGNGKFSEDKVDLSITGPDNITAGVTTTYQIAYNNNENLPLENAVLNIEYPAGFVFVSSNPNAQNAGHTQWNLGTLNAYQKGIITISGVTYSSVNQNQSWRTFLTYQPQNFNSEFQKAAVLEISASTSPFSLAITGPDKAAIGNPVEYDFAVSQQDVSQVTKMDLIPTVPTNFSITSATPSLDKNNKWSIDLTKISSSTSNTNYTFKLLGKFTTSSTANAISGLLSSSVNGKIFQLAQSEINTELLQNALGFNLAINGSMGNINAQPGDILNVTVDLKNTTNGSIKNATLKLDFDAPSLNRQSVLDWKNEADSYNANINGSQISDTVRRGEITLTKANIPGLATVKKGDEISVDIKLPIKTSDNFDLSSVSAYQVNAATEIDYTDQTGANQTLPGNPLIITLNSDLKFDPRDTVSSDNLTHQINWVLTNHAHALKNITLDADVYGDVSLSGQPTAPAGTFNFSQTSKHLTWTVPDMPNSVDTLAMPFTLVLNKTNPSQNMLVSKVTVQADDTVTGQHLTLTGDEILLTH